MFPALRTLILHDNLLLNFDINVLNSIVNIDLSYNLLKDIPDCLLNFNGMIDLTFNNIYPHPRKQPIYLGYINDIIEKENQSKRHLHNNQINNQNVRINQQIKKNKMITYNAQNVHLSSVQKSVNDSIKYLINYKKHIPYNEKYLSKLKSRYNYFYFI